MAFGFRDAFGPRVIVSGISLMAITAQLAAQMPRAKAADDPQSSVPALAAIVNRAPSEMADAVDQHERLLRAAVESRNGVFLKHRGEGDSTFSVFRRATDAVAAAADAQRLLGEARWPTPGRFEVRIAVHTGEDVSSGRHGSQWSRPVPFGRPPGGGDPG